jgi:hypothetical protein
MRYSHKQALLQIIDNDYRVPPLIYSFELCYRRLEVYRWLIKNGVTGKKFIEFYAQFNNSYLRCLKFILSKIDGVKKETIIAGKDLF